MNLYLIDKEETKTNEKIEIEILQNENISNVLITQQIINKSKYVNVIIRSDETLNKNELSNIKNIILGEINEVDEGNIILVDEDNRVSY